MKLKLSQKLIIMITSIALIAITLVIVLNVLQLKSISYEKSTLQAKEIGTMFTASFEEVSNQYLGSLEALSNMITRLHEKGTTRDEVISIVENQMRLSEGITYVNLAFEPNTFDNDVEYSVYNKYANEHDPGRFAISIVSSGASSIQTAIANLQEGDLAQFYVKTKENGTITRLNPINYGMESSPLLFSSINHPIRDADGNFIGVIGYLISLTVLQELAQTATNEHTTVALLSQNGQYVANGGNHELLGQIDEQLLADAQTMEKLMAGESVEIIDAAAHVKHNIIPMPFGKTNDTWYVKITTSEDYITKEYRETRMISLVVAIFALLILVFAIYMLINRFVIIPLNKLNDSLKHMEQGDLTQQLVINSKDEFGDMANHFNSMSEKLRDMFRHVTDLSLNVSATSEEMSASSQQTAKASENIAHAIDRVAVGAEEQHTHSITTSAEMKEMAAGVERIAESSSLAAHSSQIAEKNTVIGKEKMQQTVEQMVQMQHAVEHSNEAITALAAKSNEIKQITSLIANVSQQTNLLALNAAIEASRVGEHGKGFAVVASEIRNLADQTKQANESIAQLIEEVYNDTLTASEAMDKGTKQMTLGINSVHEAGELFSVINTEVQRVNEQITEVSAAAEQLHASSMGVAATVEQFASNASSTMNDAAEVAAASEQQLASMQEVATSSESLSVMVQELMERIAKFKI